MNRRVAIYGLHEGDEVLFYVGRTITPRHRLRGHRASFGQHITMKILERCWWNDRSRRERYWIHQVGVAQLKNVQYVNSPTRLGRATNGRIYSGERLKRNRSKMKILLRHEKATQYNPEVRSPKRRRGRPKGPSSRTARWVRIMQRKHDEGDTMQEIASEFNVTRQRVQQILSKYQ